MGHLNQGSFVGGYPTFLIFKEGEVKKRIVGMRPKHFLSDVRYFYNEHRGMIACTGLFDGTLVSAVTSGMGGSSTGISLPRWARKAVCWTRGLTAEDSSQIM